VNRGIVRIILRWVAPWRRRTAVVPSAGYPWRAAAAGLAMAVAGAAHPVLADEEGGAAACRRAGMEAERRFYLPPGLLLAIGVVESGRLDPITARMAAWPWTLNANGAGRMFESLPDALAETRALQRRGMTSIDVGCFQINLQQHPAAFASLEEAFDPSANAAYAARFLLVLRARTGSWDSAVAAYHSATPERGSSYRESVLAALTAADRASIGAVQTIVREVVWTQSSVTDGMRIWRPNAPGAAPGVIVIRRSSDP
jgi:hypothetical protein